MAADAIIDPVEGTRARFRAVFTRAPIGMALIRLDSLPGAWPVLLANARLCDILGYSAPELVTLEPALEGHPRDRDLAADQVPQMIAGALDAFSMRMPLVRADGAVLDAHLTVAAIDEPGLITHAIVHVEERCSGADLREPDHDAITGVSSRQRFEATLTRELAIATRHGRTGAVLVVDIDRFRLVNDAVGHGRGDVILQQLAALLGDRLRNEDTIGRLGDDEFGILLIETDVRGAEIVAAELVQRVRTAQTLIPVTVSVGIAAFSGDEPCTAEGVLAAAAAAVDDAKHAGTARSVTSTGRTKDAFTWHHEIARALEDERLTLYAQPVYSTTDQTLDAHELLLRMIGREGALISPASFLPTAERFGLIRALDRWVIRHALSLGGSGRLNINLSAQSLHDPRLLDWLVAELEAGGTSPERLLFEITETTAIAELGQATRFAQRLRGLGCGLALDDFGAGFASFSYLKQLPVTHVKIDRDFVRGLASSDIDQHIVAAIVSVARGAGIATVAEGIEDRSTLQLVQALGVDYVQGFHLGRPHPADEARMSHASTGLLNPARSD